MIEDKDAELLAAKMTEIQKAEKKKKSKLENYLLIGVAIGGLYVGVIAWAAFDITDQNENALVKTQQKIIDAQNEIIKIKSLPCNDLKYYTPQDANLDYQIIEMLQRCV